MTRFGTGWRAALLAGTLAASMAGWGADDGHAAAAPVPAPAPDAAVDVAVDVTHGGGAVSSTGIAGAPTVAPVTGLVLPRTAYPFARRDGAVEKPFGQAVADPWRWLEADLRTSPDVADWVARENSLTTQFLKSLPGRDAFAARIRNLFDYPRVSLPRKAGRSYFYLRNTGLQNQSALYVQEGQSGTPRLLLDPNAWSADGSQALDLWVPSRSGRFLAFGRQRDGSDWRTLGVVDARSGQVLDDALEWANDTLIGWLGDEGFLYSRYPAPAQGQAYRAVLSGKAVWFHRVGTPQSADELVFATPDHPEWGHKAFVTSDGRWAVITTEASTDARRMVHLVDLRGGAWRNGQWQVLPLVDNFDHEWKVVEGLGDRLWFITTSGAANGMVAELDLGGAAARWRVVVPERRQTLAGGNVVGDRLILSYQHDGATTAVVTDLKGKPARAITLNGIGVASGFAGKPGDSETFYQFSSFNLPPTIFRLDLKTGAATPFAQPRLSFDPADYVVEQRRYRSKDGTMVPLYLVRSRRAAQAGQALPTLLYGYGGFDVALTPGWSPVRMAWLSAGGAFALANIRGGGEFGQAWHDGGRLAAKQNSFDDFIAAGEYLIAQGVTPKGGLAIQGSSNGGLLVGAVVNQRPDLFAAANPDVGVMDMLRFDRFTAGRFWVDDYGDPARAADWQVLRAYSPYHNIRDGARYPAILVTTADTDDRVVPAHSFKYVAALQAADIGTRPHLLRVEQGAGHGGGKSVDKVIAGGADVLAFLAAYTGLDAPPPAP
ncbi:MULTISPECIES: prolyl oligopeptidase family serine peptidase [unclassified Novosphingobium]|uniref:prolyl oligopeptidase family serine peptidase n=1 Tax=unclassified Novosphingobium TaxID=2644732 RepID=UPI0017E634CC|nr:MULTISPECIES: prolyl oligopeptidase family serine peptidase [unclassified Novosphingobium]NMN06355.1 prolyl oligopeptidase [Novosphingobium sp. SG919]NMN88653.1 prolyl oligopeptidase [Novosphingobium sp. SG916]